MKRASGGFYQSQDLRYIEFGRSPLVYNAALESWVMFDEVHKHVVFHNPGSVSWMPFFPPRIRCAPIPLRHTGPILCAKLSVDSAFLCYQVSTTEIVSLIKIWMLLIITVNNVYQIVLIIKF
eukprot:TRINITY_DN2732_c0_g1_i7.p1 TRINITY_DN2732_c0_g1~~TRINITY_DN2732_c0_g1_i7.p1  ORF type:complete len:122 (+),score=8.81 TRINITY_DN2732_c0_g1_i7:82-447(+)